MEAACPLPFFIHLMNRINLLLAATACLLAATACDDPKAITEGNDLSFTVTNLNVPQGQTPVSAHSPGSKPVTNITITVTTVVNGESVTTTVQSNSAQLIVEPGDRLVIMWAPAKNEKEALFTMPDGTEHTVMHDAPEFLWTVPSDFDGSANITGYSHWEKDNIESTQRGYVTLRTL